MLKICMCIEKQKYRKRSQPWFISQTPTMDKPGWGQIQGNLRYWEGNLSLPNEWQGPKYLRHHLLPPWVNTNGKLRPGTGAGIWTQALWFGVLTFQKAAESLSQVPTIFTWILLSFARQSSNFRDYSSWYSRAIFHGKKNKNCWMNCFICR